MINIHKQLTIGLILFLFAQLGLIYDAVGQVGNNNLFCNGVSIDNGILQFEIDYNTNTPSDFTGGLMGTVEDFVGITSGGLDWMHMYGDSGIEQSFTPTNETGSQLIGWWNLKTGRVTQFQVSNYSTTFLNVHIHFLDENCNLILNFCDSFTSLDTHLYDLTELRENFTGDEIDESSLLGNEGIMVVTAVDSCPTPGNAIQQDTLSGNITILDPLDYQYGVNMYARKAICFDDQQFACQGVLTGAPSARLDTFNPPMMSGLFSAPSGNAAADVVLMNIRDDYGPPYSPLAGLTDLTVNIIDEFEELTECGTTADTCFLRLGIDDNIGGSGGFEPEFRLNIFKTGDGGGSVSSNPSGISCGSTCAAAFPNGQDVTLTATPDSNSNFISWSGDCSGDEEEIQVTMDQVRNCTARFDIKRFVLTVNKLSNGTGTVNSIPSGIFCGTSCNSTNTIYLLNTSVTLIANPAPGSVFAGWSGDTDCIDGVVFMNEDRTCNAIFSQDVNEAFLIVTKDGTGDGDVTSSPAGIDCGSDCVEGFNAAANQVVTLTPTAAPGSTFTEWGGDPDCEDGVVTMSVSKTCVAIFDSEEFALTVVVNGTGSGSVESTPPGIMCGGDCTEVYNNGQVVGLTPTAGPGSVFVGWSGNDDCSDGILTMDMSKSCTATFDAVESTLTIVKIGTGTGTVTSVPTGINCGADCVESYPENTAVTLTAIPGSSIFGGWTGDPDCADGMVTMDTDILCVAIFNDPPPSPPGAPNPPSANLSVNKSVNADMFEVGSELTYMIVVDNNGPNTATDVQLTDILPSGVTIVSVPEGCNVIGNGVFCDLGDMTNGAEDILSIVVIPTQPGAITNTAIVNSSGVVDDNADNNVSSVSVGDTLEFLTIEPNFEEVMTSNNGAVSIPVDISNPNSTQTSSRDSSRDDSLTQTKQTATGVIFTVELPEGFDISDLTTTQGTCSIELLECDLGDIDPGETVTVIVDAISSQGNGVFNVGFLVSTSSGQEFRGDATVVVTGDGANDGGDGGGCALIENLDQTNPTANLVILFTPIIAVCIIGIIRRRRSNMIL